ncbi:MAG: beta-ketoacyl-ACP synthase 3, partial [Desulfomicrobium sp.]|nr:beta-ketoacyl-ACP synthase 3 [Desulfomicrobium sp.]
GDYNMPSTSCLLQDLLGLKGLPAFDLAAACSGFLYCLETARAYTCLYPDARILVVGSEVTTARINFEDRTTCVLFGDGAGAAVVTGQANPGRIRVVDAMLKADGSVGGLLTIHGGGSACKPVLGQTIGPEYFVEMNGRDVFKHAVRFMADISGNLLERNGLTTNDIDLIIPHQANMRIIEAISKKLGVDMDKIYVNLDRIGNTSAASIPIALTEAEANGRIQPGMKVLLTAFGGGFTWASALLQF